MAGLALAMGDTVYKKNKTAFETSYFTDHLIQNIHSNLQTRVICQILISKLSDLVQ